MASKSYQGLIFLSREVSCGKPLAFSKNVPLFFYRFFQSLIWYPLRWFFSFFGDFEIKSEGKTEKLKGPLIIVANHSSWIDSFLVAGAFPFGSKIFPIRFACWHKYYYRFRNYFFVRLLGAFPIKSKIGLENSLSAAIKILKNKGVVAIFPEGKRFHRGRHRKGRRGAAFLALKTKAKLLPIKIEEPASIRWDGFLLRRYKIKVKIGKPFSVYCEHPAKAEREEDLNQATDIIMKKIREL